MSGDDDEPRGSLLASAYEEDDDKGENARALCSRSSTPSSDWELVSRSESDDDLAALNKDTATSPVAQPGASAPVSPPPSVPGEVCTEGGVETSSFEAFLLQPVPARGASWDSLQAGDEERHQLGFAEVHWSVPAVGQELVCLCGGVLQRLKRALARLAPPVSAKAAQLYSEARAAFHSAVASVLALERGTVALAGIATLGCVLAAAVMADNWSLRARVEGIESELNDVTNHVDAIHLALSRMMNRGRHHSWRRIHIR